MIRQLMIGTFSSGGTRVYFLYAARQRYCFCVATTSAGPCIISYHGRFKRFALSFREANRDGDLSLRGTIRPLGHRPSRDRQRCPGFSSRAGQPRVASLLAMTTGNAATAATFASRRHPASTVQPTLTPPPHAPRRDPARPRTPPAWPHRSPAHPEESPRCAPPAAASALPRRRCPTS
jgi:hypothetical protein